MLERLPHTVTFTRLYWNMARDDHHLETDFRRMMEDARGFPDQGLNFYADMARELALISGDQGYADWARTAGGSRRIIRDCGGRVVTPDLVPILSSILSEYRPRPSRR